MNKGLAFICIVSLVLGFQNCAPNGLQGLSGNTAVDDSLIMLPPSTGETPDLKTASTVDYFEIPTFYSDDKIPSADYMNGSVAPNRIVVSMKTGAIKLMDSQNTVLAQKCMPAAKFEELKTILDSVKICKTTVPADDVMCAQVYKQGYAALVTAGQRTNLGEMKNSCGYGTVDVCGAVSALKNQDRANLLRAYASDLHKNWLSLTCDYSSGD